MQAPSKTLLLFLLSFLCNLLLKAQNASTIDSLTQVLESAIPDRERVDTYNQLASSYDQSDSLSIINYAKMAIELAENINYPKGKINALMHIGNMKFYTESHLEAESIFKRILLEAKHGKHQKTAYQCLLKLGIICRYQSDYEKALSYFFQSLEIAEILNDESLISKTNKQIGVIYYYQGEYAKALSCYSRSQQIAEEIGDKQAIADIHTNIGLVYRFQGSYEKALESHFKSIEINKALGNKQNIGICNSNIGVIFKILGNYDKALAHYSISLKTYEALNDRRGMGYAYGNIGSVYAAQGETAKALDFHFKSLDISKELGDKMSIGITFENIGIVYKAEGDYEKALAYYFQSLEICKQIGAKADMSYPLVAIGEAYMKLKRWELAKKHLHEAMLIAQEAGLTENILTAAESLAKIGKELGHYQSAYEAHVLFKAMADTLKNKEQTRKITRLEAEYEFKQEKDSIQYANTAQRLALEKDIEQRKTAQLATSVVLGLSVALAIILFLFFKAKSRSHKLLRDKSDELTIANRQLEISHLEVEQKADHIASLNQLLQQNLDKTASNLLIKNEKSEEYAFFNSHKTRAPLARILGLVAIINPKHLDEETAFILEKVIENSKELDEIVKEMNVTLSEAGFFENTSETNV